MQLCSGLCRCSLHLAGLCAVSTRPGCLRVLQRAQTGNFRAWLRAIRSLIALAQISHSAKPFQQRGPTSRPLATNSSLQYWIWIGIKKKEKAAALTDLSVNRLLFRWLEGLCHCVTVLLNLNTNAKLTWYSPDSSLLLYIFKISVAPSSN